MKAFFRKLESWVHVTSLWTCRIAGLILVILVGIVTIDVLGRKMGHPLMGSIDLGEIMLIPIAFFAMAYTQSIKGHVKVKIIIEHLPRRVQALLDTITLLLSTLIYALIVYAMVNRALGVIQSTAPGPVTSLLEIPIVPFYGVIAFGCLLLCLELIVDIVHALTRLLTVQTA
jgi:TRAP-type C4-dicarboxylate transport system permease small subunit